MDKKNGAVREVIALASRIGALRAEAARLNEEIAACEDKLESMLGGAPRRGRSSIRTESDTPVTKTVAKSPKGRGKARKAASKPKRKAAKNGAARGGTIMEAIVGALEARRGEPMSVTNVADAVGANPASVATMLKRLVERGRIVKPSLGRYQAN